MKYIEEKVKNIIIDLLVVEKSKVVNKANFIDDLGADSLDVIELVMTFEDKFGITIPDEELDKLGTVEDVIFYIKNNQYTVL